MASIWGYIGERQRNSELSCDLAQSSYKTERKEREIKKLKRIIRKLQKKEQLTQIEQKTIEKILKQKNL